MRLRTKILLIVFGVVFLYAAADHALQLCLRSSRFTSLERDRVNEEDQATWRAAAARSAAAALVTGLVALPLLLLFLKKHVVRPILLLANRFAEARASGDLSRRVGLERKDEIGTLARQFDGLLEAVEGTVRARQLACERLESEVAERTRAESALREANVRLQELAATDELTGLWNRRRFLEALEHEYRRIERRPKPLSLAIFDLDHFKSVNDIHGHDFGDRVLRQFADVLRANVRASDIACRIGGDEFAVVMPATPADRVVMAASRIKSSLCHRPLIEGCSHTRITATAGIATLDRPGCASVERLIRWADEALFAAKNAGGDRIMTWEQVRQEPEPEVATEGTTIRHLRRRLGRLASRSREMFVRSVQSLVQALEVRDPYTRNHSDNVTHYSVAVARELGVEESQVEVIRRAAVVHDIGKIGLPDSILQKPGPLDPEERRIVEQHVTVGVGILEQLHTLDREIPIMRHHHERWDGGGYPDGLAGEAIPLGSRILAVADAFDAITSDRFYHKAQSVSQALRTLIDESGRQFAPSAAEAMARWVGKFQESMGRVTVEDLLAVDLTAAA